MNLSASHEDRQLKGDPVLDYPDAELCKLLNKCDVIYKSMWSPVPDNFD